MSSARAGLQATGNATPYTAAATVIPRPTFLDDKDQVVDEHPLHCSICCDISYKPVVTPCQHVFCRECIISGIQGNPSCPNDRRALTANSLKNITGLHEYIYDHTRVKCPRCDKWTGQMKHYKQHVPTCTSSSYVQTLERKVQQLTTQHATQTANMQRTIDRLEATLAQERQAVSLNTEELNRSHAAEKEQLQSRIDALENDVSALNSRISSMGPAFDPNYRYDESNALALSRVISRYLLEKPDGINANRIFNCVKKCYDGTIRYESNYWDRISVVMLLLTCYRSTWFTPNQADRIEEWCRSLSW